MYVAPKWPRISVSPKRHKKLAIEAGKLGVSISALADEKFEVAEAARVK